MEDRRHAGPLHGHDPGRGSRALVPGQAGDGRLTAELGVPQPNEAVRLQNRRLRIQAPLGTLVSYNPILFVRCLGEAVWFPAVAASPTTVQVLVTLSRVAVPGMEPGVLAAMRHRPASRGTTQALRRSELPVSCPAVRPFWGHRPSVIPERASLCTLQGSTNANRDRCGKGRRTGRGGYGYNISMIC